MSKEKQKEGQTLTKLDKVNTVDMFQSYDNFINIWKMAGALSKSTLIPKEFQGNAENVMISLEMASRLKVSPFMVMQNIYVIYGRPSFSSKFLIGLINTCGRFKTCLQFEFSGKGDDFGCVAYATFDGQEKPTYGSRVTIKMAKEEGWYGKTGSKWKTMPEKMLRYRSASFFANEITPELIMGMQTTDEAEDVYKEVKAEVEDEVKKEVTENQATEELDIDEPKKDKISETAKEIQEKNKSKKEEKKEDECQDEPGF